MFIAITILNKVVALIITFSSIFACFLFSQLFKPPAPVRHSVPKKIKSTDGVGKSHSFLPLTLCYNILFLYFHFCFP